MKRYFARFFAFYFLIGGLYPNTDFAQLWHTASALQHYKLHKSEAEASAIKCTIWTFIRDHYINPESHQHDDLADHDQLPAKHMHNALDLIVQFQEPEAFVYLLFPSRNQIGFLDASYSFLFNPGVYRPPSLV